MSKRPFTRSQAKKQKNTPPAKVARRELDTSTPDRSPQPSTSYHDDSRWSPSPINRRKASLRSYRQRIESSSEEEDSLACMLEEGDDVVVLHTTEEIASPARSVVLHSSSESMPEIQSSVSEDSFVCQYARLRKMPCESTPDPKRRRLDIEVESPYASPISLKHLMANAKHETGEDRRRRYLIMCSRFDFFDNPKRRPWSEASVESPCKQDESCVAAMEQEEPTPEDHHDSGVMDAEAVESDREESASMNSVNPEEEEPVSMEQASFDPYARRMMSSNELCFLDMLPERVVLKIMEYKRYAEYHEFNAGKKRRVALLHKELKKLPRCKIHKTVRSIHVMHGCLFL